MWNLNKVEQSSSILAPSEISDNTGYYMFFLVYVQSIHTLLIFLHRFWHHILKILWYRSTKSSTYDLLFSLLDSDTLKYNLAQLVAYRDKVCLCVNESQSQSLIQIKYVMCVCNATNDEKPYKNR